MPDLETTRRLLSAARRDLQSIGNMLDREKFPDETFGLLAQQAEEKCLKAWLAARDQPVPRTHNLRLLIILLEQTGVVVPQEWHMLELTAFAVQFRYDACDTMDEPLNRPMILQHITELFSNVTVLLDTLAESSNPG
ncbi:MAG: HEPN domain-containing protein [Magnetococcales bacterium]|nr:HEPN domain-containing protein [Magnetococcales bacterium]